MIGAFAVVLTALLITNALLRDSERARKQLADNLEKIQAGEESLRLQKIDRLLEQGYQRAFGVDARSAIEAFEKALQLDSEDRDALTGLAFTQLPNAAASHELIDAQSEGGDDPELRSLRQMIDAVAGTESAPEAREDESALQAFQRGLATVRAFHPPIQAEALKRARSAFREAVLRADRPRFHFWHAVLMSATRANDRGDMDEAARTLEHHWPDSPATWEAIAQFYFTVDEERAVAAMWRSIEIEDSAPPHLGLAQWHLRHKRNDDAIAELELASRLAPRLEAVAWMRGRTLIALQRRDEARVVLEAFLALEPEAAWCGLSSRL